MKLAVKKLKKAQDNRTYTIQLPNQQQLIIFIQETHQKKRYSLNLTKQLLKQNNLTPKELYLSIYKQFILQNEMNRWVFILEPNCINIKFNYPKCQIKELSFQCTVISFDDSKIKLQEFQKIYEDKVNKMKKIYEGLKAKIQELVTTKLAQFQQNSDNVLKQKTSKLQKLSDDILQQINVYSTQIQQKNEKRYEKYMNDSVKKILDNNVQIIQELDTIRVSLQGEIQILNENIKQQNTQIKQLEKQIQSNKEQFSDEHFQIKTKMQNIHALLQKKLQVLQTQIFKKIERELGNLQRQVVIIENKKEKSLHQYFSDIQQSETDQNMFLNESEVHSINNANTKKKHFQQQKPPNQQLHFQSP